VAAQEEATRVAEKAAATAAQEAVAVAAREVARVEELAEEAATDAAAREEMARDHRRWDEDLAAARHAREIHELTSERHHRIRLARHQAQRARHTDCEGSNAIDAG
jgi:hypothetical protein